MTNNKEPITIPSQCPYCESAIKYIPAGVSRKTGKYYNEFWACENRNCNFTWRIPSKTSSQIPKVIPTSEGEIVKGLRELWKQNETIIGLLKEIKDK